MSRALFQGQAGGGGPLGCARPSDLESLLPWLYRQRGTLHGLIRPLLLCARQPAGYVDPLHANEQQTARLNCKAPNKQHP